MLYVAADREKPNSPRGVPFGWKAGKEKLHKSSYLLMVCPWAGPPGRPATISIVHAAECWGQEKEISHGFAVSPRASHGRDAVRRVPLITSVRTPMQPLRICSLHAFLSDESRKADRVPAFVLRGI